jgi:formylglycine-generating enzyme required for sulfatase activity
MKTSHVIILIAVACLAACNLPAPTAVLAPANDGPAAGIPQFLTNASDPGDGLPTGPQVGTTMLWVDHSILVYVPGGEFAMGSEAGDIDHPVHTVTLSPFWIYRAEVTNTQYAMCIAAGQCGGLQDPEAAAKLSDPALRDHPVTGVSHAQGEAYCTWVQGDLPTEAQWEKTARGPEANTYPWGEDAPMCDLTNFNECLLETTDIRAHLNGRSHYEALDLAGNVFEWVWDWYSADYYNSSPPVDPPGPTDGVERVVRGGGYQTVETDLYSARRFSLDPAFTRPDLGFRCVVNNPGNFAPYCTASPLFTGGREPGGPGADDPGSACEPPRVNVGGSYCTLNRAFVNIFAEGEVSIADDALACNDAGDGLLTCSGPHNFSGEVQVCGSCDAAAVEGEAPAGLDQVPPGPEGQCPNEAYVYREETGLCEWLGDEGEPFNIRGEVFCQVGSEPDPTGSFCTAPPQPADGAGECPNVGYRYDAATGMCHWGWAGSRPYGICLDPATGLPHDRSRCEPGGDLGGFSYFCPLGMELDASGQFCVQVAQDAPPAECPNGICDVAEDDFACPVGTFLDEGLGVCVPASGMPGGVPGVPGCIPGFVFDPEFACCQAVFDNSSACAAGELVDPMLGCINPPSFNDAPGSSCITVKVGLPNCARDTGDDPGDGNTCAEHSGDYGACIAAGCSYDTLTNTCN